MTLEHERKVYQTHLMELLGHAGENEGKFIAIEGDEIIVPFDDYESKPQTSGSHLFTSRRYEIRITLDERRACLDFISTVKSLLPRRRLLTRK